MEPAISVDTLLPVFGFQIPVSEVSWQKILISLSAKKQQYYVFAKHITNKLLAVGDIDNKDLLITTIAQRFTELTNSEALIKMLQDKPSSGSDAHYVIETDRPFIRSGDYSIPKLLDMVKSKTSMDFNCYYSLYESGSWKKCNTIFVSVPYYLSHRDGSASYEFDHSDFEKLRTIFNYKGIGPERQVIADLRVCDFVYTAAVDDTEVVRKFTYKLIN